MTMLYVLAAAFGAGAFWLATNFRVVKQFERGVVFRFGKVQQGVRGPGLRVRLDQLPALAQRDDPADCRGCGESDSLDP